MTFTVLLDGIEIGRSELEERDRERGALSGSFRATRAWPVVQTLMERVAPLTLSTVPPGEWERLRPYYRGERYGTEFAVLDGRGEPVEVAGLSVPGRRSAPGARLEVYTLDPALWRRLAAEP